LRSRLPKPTRTLRLAAKVDRMLEEAARRASVVVAGLRRTRETMMLKIHQMCRALLMAGIAGAVIVAAGSAPSSAKETRGAALERCFAQARGSGEVTPGGAGGENRAAVYKDCMRKAGYNP
jgi:uncharacterized membrane protein